MLWWYFGTDHCVVGDEGDDGGRVGAPEGERAVVGLEEQVVRREPGRGQPLRPQLAAQQLGQTHAPTAPVQQLVHVAQRVDGQHDAHDHKADHQQRQQDAAPVAPFASTFIHQPLKT